MSQFPLTLPQVSTALRLASLTPVAGSPLQGLGETLLPANDEGCVRMSAFGLLDWERTGWRVNRAFALSLAVAAAPDEVIWVEAGEGTGLTLCRRERFAVECTAGQDGLVKWVFPQIWALIPEMLGEAFQGGAADDPLEPSDDFAFSGPPEAAFLLSVILHAAEEQIPCKLDGLQTLVDRALANPRMTMPFVKTGCGDSLLKLLPEGNQVAACALSLIGGGLIDAHSGMLRPVDTLSRVFGQARPDSAMTFRRRLFTWSGHVTMELSAVRVGERLLVWSLEARFPEEPSCRWRLLTPNQFRAEALRILGWPAKPSARQ
jgi:hypothetical protein